MSITTKGDVNVYDIDDRTQKDKMNIWEGVESQNLFNIQSIVSDNVLLLTGIDMGILKIRFISKISLKLIQEQQFPDIPININEIVKFQVPIYSKNTKSIVVKYLLKENTAYNSLTIAVFLLVSDTSIQQPANQIYPNYKLAYKTKNPRGEYYIYEPMSYLVIYESTTLFFSLRAYNFSGSKIYDSGLSLTPTGLNSKSLFADQNQNFYYSDLFGIQKVDLSTKKKVTFYSKGNIITFFLSQDTKFIITFAQDASGESLGQVYSLVQNKTIQNFSTGSNTLLTKIDFFGNKVVINSQQNKIIIYDGDNDYLIYEISQFGTIIQYLFQNENYILLIQENGIAHYNLQSREYAIIEKYKVQNQNKTFLDQNPNLPYSFSVNSTQLIGFKSFNQTILSQYDYVFGANSITNIKVIPEKNLLITVFYNQTSPYAYIYNINTQKLIKSVDIQAKYLGNRAYSTFWEYWDETFFYKKKNYIINSYSYSISIIHADTLDIDLNIEQYNPGDVLDDKLSLYYCSFIDENLMYAYFIDYYLIRIISLISKQYILKYNQQSFKPKIVSYDVQRQLFFVVGSSSLQFVTIKTFNIQNLNKVPYTSFTIVEPYYKVLQKIYLIKKNYFMKKQDTLILFQGNSDIVNFISIKEEEIINYIQLSDNFHHHSDIVVDEDLGIILIINISNQLEFLSLKEYKRIGRVQLGNSQNELLSNLRKIIWDPYKLKTMVMSYKTAYVIDFQQQVIVFKHTQNKILDFKLFAQSNQLFSLDADQMLVYDYGQILSNFDINYPNNLKQQYIQLNDYNIIIMSRLDCSLKLLINNQIQDVYQISSEKYCVFQIGTISKQNNIIFAIYKQITFILEINSSNTFNLIIKKQLNSSLFRILIDNISLLCQLTQNFDVYCLNKSASKNELSYNLILNINDGINSFYTNSQQIYLFTSRTDQKNLQIFNYQSQSTQQFSYSNQNIISVQMLNNEQALILLESSIVLINIANAQIIQQSNLLDNPIKCTKCKLYIDKLNKKIFVISQFYDGMIFDYLLIKYQQSLKVPGTDLVFNDKFIFVKSPTSCNIYSRRDLKFIQSLRQFSSSDYLDEIYYSGQDFLFIVKFRNKLSLFEISQLSKVVEKDFLIISNFQLINFELKSIEFNQILFQVQYLQNEGVFNYTNQVFINYSPISTQCSIIYPSLQYPLTSAIDIQKQTDDLIQYITIKNLILKSIRINLQQSDYIISYPLLQQSTISDYSSLQIVGYSKKDNKIQLNYTVSNLQNFYNLIIEQVNIHFEKEQQNKIEFQKLQTAKLSKIIIKDVQFSNFSFKTLYFKDLSSVIIDNLLIEFQEYQNDDISFLIFERVQTIIIKNFTIQQSQFNIQQPFISISNSTQVIIQNMEFITLNLSSNNMQSLFRFDNSEKINIENIKIDNSTIDFSLFFDIIQSQEFITLKNINIKNSNFTVSDQSQNQKNVTLFCQIEQSQSIRITDFKIINIITNLTNQISYIFNFQQPLSLLSISETIVRDSLCYNNQNSQSKQSCQTIYYGVGIKNGIFENMSLTNLNYIGLFFLSSLQTKDNNNFNNKIINIQKIKIISVIFSHPIIFIETGEITIKNSLFFTLTENQKDIPNSGILITNSEYIEFNSLEIRNIVNLFYCFINILESNLIIIQQSKFLNVNQVLLFDNVKMLKLFENQFINNKSKFNGSSLSLKLIKSSIISKNIFNEGISSEGHGGSLYCEDSLIEELTFNQFINNKAQKGSGGAIYLQSCDLLKFKQNSFKNNYAVIGGGIRYQLIKPLFLVIRSLNEIKQQNLFYNNIGSLYGQDITSYPVILDIKNQFGDEDGITPILQDVQSGFQANQPIEMRFIDEENREINFPKIEKQSDLYHNDIIIEFQQYILKIESENIGLQGDLIQQYNYEYNSFYFNVTFSFKPSKSDQVTLSSRQLLPYFQQGQQSVSQKNFASRLIINFRNCILGETKQKINENYVICSPCAIESYSIVDPDKNSDVECKKCPVGAYQCQKDQINVLNGYWKKSELSDIIIQCKNSEDACIPQDQNQRNGCSEGHLGPLCESCDIHGLLWEKPYGVSSDFRCVDCESISNIVNILYICIVFIFIISYSFAQIYKQILLSQNQTKLNYLRKLHILFLSKSANLTSGSTYMKILICYFQFLMLVNSIEIKLPTLFYYFNVAGGDPSYQTFYSIDCLFHNISNVPIYLARTIWSLFQPIAIFIGFNLAYDIYLTYSKNNKQIPLFQASFNFIFLFYQPSIARILIQSSSCRQIGDEKYIMTDITSKCHTEDHNSNIFLIFLPLLIVWLIIIPLYQITSLRQNKHKFKRISFIYRFGYLYQEYKDDVYYWDQVRIFLRSIIIVSLNFYSSSPIMKALIIVLVMTIYINRSEAYSPYKLDNQNKVDRQSCKVVILTIYLLLLNYFGNDDIMSIISFSLMIFFNLIFIFTMVQMIMIKIIPYKEEDRNLFQKLLFLIKKIFPFMMNNIKVATISRYRVNQLWKKVKISIPVFSQVQNSQENKLSYLMKSNLIKNKQSLFHTESVQFKSNRKIESNRLNEKKDQNNNICMTLEISEWQ